MIPATKNTRLQQMLWQGVFRGSSLLLLSSITPVFAEGLKDIRGPVALPGDWIWLWWLLGGVVLGGALYAIFRARAARPSPLVTVPQRPPWDLALEELEALQRESRSGEEGIKRYYSRLSQIIRVYIERRFEIRAPEMTTEEFLEKVKGSASLSAEQKRSLQELLNASDLAKFAKTFPSDEVREESLRLARRFVEETRLESVTISPSAGR